MQLFAEFLYHPIPVFLALSETVVEVHETFKTCFGLEMDLIEKSFFLGFFLSISVNSKFILDLSFVLAKMWQLI